MSVRSADMSLDQHEAAAALGGDKLCWRDLHLVLVSQKFIPRVFHPYLRMKFRRCSSQGKVGSVTMLTPRIIILAPRDVELSSWYCLFRSSTGKEGLLVLEWEMNKT